MNKELKELLILKPMNKELLILKPIVKRYEEKKVVQISFDSNKTNPIKEFLKLFKCDSKKEYIWLILTLIQFFFVLIYSLLNS